MLDADAPPDGLYAGSFRHEFTRHAAASGSSSLIALSIRLNI
jgi:hypothetical protein